MSFGWILSIVKLFTGLDITGLVGKAVDAYGKSKDTDVALDAAQKNLVAKEAELDVKEAQINANVVIAEQGNWLTRLARPAIAMPFIIYIWKIVIWDKVLGWGVTDALSPEFTTIMGVVITTYFGGRTIEKVASIVKGTFR